MKFIDTTTTDFINSERTKTIVSVSTIIIICVASIFIMSNLLNAEAMTVTTSVDESIKELVDTGDVEFEPDMSLDVTESNPNDEYSVELISETSDDTISSDDSDNTEPLESSNSSVLPSSDVSAQETISETTTAESSEVPSETTSEVVTEVTSTPVPTSTPAPTSTPVPTATPTPAIVETAVIKLVYAKSELNVRSGPSTSSPVVKTLNPGDGIDVIAVTDNGWYKTYNNNYVLAELTTEVAPATPTPVPTSAPAPQATPTPVPAPAQTTTTVINGENMTLYGSCTITFYGPQPMGDGSYSTSTATGTTCTQGRTCAADWGVFPAGTVLYIENDPLGGDGYYTVEDRGPGVNGSHIDVYADDGESSNYSTTSRNVYVVN